MSRIHYKVEKIPLTDSAIKKCPVCNRALGGTNFPQLCGGCKTYISVESGYIFLKKKINLWAIEHKGHDYLHEGNYLEAKKLFKNTLEFEKGDSYLWLHYGITLLNLNEFNEAEKWLNKTIKIQDCLHSTEAKYEKAYLYSLRGRIEKCINLLGECFQENIYFLDKVLDDSRFAEIHNNASFSKLVKPKLEYKVNDHISLKLFKEKTIIYIFNKVFLTCQRLVLNIPVENMNTYDHYTSIDQIVENSEILPIQKANINISSGEEFWAHCSNIQAWVEHDYSTQILAYEISFGILNKLSKNGVKKAQMIFKEEIIKRLKISPRDIKPSTIVYFLEEGYISILSQEEIFYGLLDLNEASIMEKIAGLMNQEYTLTIEIMEAYRASYTTKGKLHVFIYDGHVKQLEIILNESNFKVIDLFSHLTCLNVLFFNGSFWREDVGIKLRRLGFNEHLNPRVWIRSSKH